MRYYDPDVARFRSSDGRFAPGVVQPDETCPSGCERYGDWWVPADCAKHLGVAS